MKHNKERIFLNYLFKWLFVIFALFAFVCILFNVITYAREQAYFSEIIEDGQQDRINYLARTLNGEIAKIKVTANVILSEDTVLDLYCQYGVANSFEKSNLIQNVKQRCMEIVNLNSFVKDASFYLLDENLKISKEEYEYVDHSIPYQFAEIGQKGGIFQMEGENGYIIDVLNKNYMGDKWDKDNILGLFVITLDQEVIQNELSYAKLTDNDILLITSRDKKQIYFGTDKIDPSVLEQGMKDYLAIETDEESNFFQIIYLQEQNIKKIMKQKMVINVLLFVVIILLSLIIAVILFYKYVFKPLEVLLVDAFLQIKQSNLSYRIPESENGVFSGLYQNFNYMAERIDTLVSKELKQEILVNQANFKHLQSQINPHFMYNSYFLLYRLIKANDREASLQVCESLGNFFKYINRDSNDTKSLADEISHARSYGIIQSYRYRGIITTEFEELPEKYAYIVVPRLIIQPVIENVFKYVINEMEEEEKIVLRVSYQEEDALTIRIENSGNLSEEKLQEIRQRIYFPEEGEEVTALVNINTRLNVFFQQERSVEIYRSDLGGMDVQIRVKL